MKIPRRDARSLAAFASLFVASAAAAAGTGGPPCRTWELENPMPGELTGFGAEAALGGDTIVMRRFGLIEAPELTIHRFDGDTWVFEQTVPLEGDAEQDHFQSRKLWTDGETILLGRPRERATDEQPQRSGAVYEIRRSDGVWVVKQRAFRPSEIGLAAFGWAIDADAERVIVGVPNSRRWSKRGGLAVIYRRSSEGWIEEAELGEALATWNRRVARGVAIDGDLAAITLGAPDRGTATTWRGEPGLAIYRRTGGVWNLEATFPIFAQEIRIVDGDVLVDDFIRETVRVLRPVDGTWSVVTEILGVDASGYNFFGGRIRPSGNLLAVSDFYDSVEHVRGGAVFLYARDGDDWIPVRTLRPEWGTSDSRFGAGLGFDGRRLVVGAYVHGGGAGRAEVHDVGNFFGDLDCDGTIDALDLADLLASWGPCDAGDCSADLDASGAVDATDLAIMFAAWDD